MSNNMFQELLLSIPERNQRVKKIARRLEPVQAPKKRGRPLGSKNKKNN